MLVASAKHEIISSYCDQLNSYRQTLTTAAMSVRSQWDLSHAFIKTINQCTFVDRTVKWCANKEQYRPIFVPS